MYSFMYIKINLNWVKQELVDASFVASDRGKPRKAQSDQESYIYVARENFKKF